LKVTFSESLKPNAELKLRETTSDIHDGAKLQDDRIAFKTSCDLYNFSNDKNELVEKGYGIISILENNDNTYYILVKSRDSKIWVNHPINSNIIKSLNKNEKQVRCDLHDCNDEKFTIEFRDEYFAEKFISTIESVRPKHNVTMIQTHFANEIENNRTYNFV
jgi:hypothetical protein